MQNHPEICTGIHTELCLAMAERLNASPAARFAVLVHDLGKALTPKHELPKHIDHEHRGLAPVQAVCERLGVPDYWRRLSLLVCEHHLSAHRAFEMRSKSALKLLNTTGLEFDGQLLEDFVVACEADKRGRLGKTENRYKQGIFWRAAHQALQALPLPEGLTHQDPAAQKRHAERLHVVRAAAAPYRPPPVPRASSGDGYDEDDDTASC